MNDIIKVALPTGRVQKTAIQLFGEAGFAPPPIDDKDRKLFFVNEKEKIGFFFVKPSDTCLYVEKGIADIGISGKDIILETQSNIFELLDLNIGKCRMAVAGKKDFRDDESKVLRVATKFVNIAESYFDAKGREIEIIKLNGSVELAPILNLSDVIVDIVETGKTLEANNLKVFETIQPICACLIANISSYQFKKERILEITKAIEKLQNKETK